MTHTHKNRPADTNRFNACNVQNQNALFSWANWDDKRTIERTNRGKNKKIKTKAMSSYWWIDRKTKATNMNIKKNCKLNGNEFEPNQIFMTSTFTAEFFFQHYFQCNCCTSKGVFVLFCQQNCHAVTSNKQTNKQNAFVWCFLFFFNFEPLEQGCNNASWANYMRHSFKHASTNAHIHKWKQ